MLLGAHCARYPSVRQNCNSAPEAGRVVQPTRPRPVQVELRRSAVSTAAGGPPLTPRRDALPASTSEALQVAGCRRRAVSGCRHDACTCTARNRSAVRPCSCQQASNACIWTLRSPSIPAGRTRSFAPAQSILSSTRQQQGTASSFAAACVLLGRFPSCWHGSRAFVRLGSMRKSESLIALTT